MLTAGRHIDVLVPLLPHFLSSPTKHLVKVYRRLTACFRGRPDFLIIGARKCGTTSIYHYLTRHPSVRPALKKEVFYFDHFFDKGERWYRQHFPTLLETWFFTRTIGVPAITGEATPSYMTNPSVPRRVRAMNRAIKLVVILRDPVAAAYSSYQFGLLRGNYTAAERPFRELVRNELNVLSTTKSVSPDAHPGLLLPRYVYVNQLTTWLEDFPRHQIHILFLESFIHSPQEHYNRLLWFLGLPPHELNSFKPYNANRYPAMSGDICEQLRSFYRPHNHRLAELTGLCLPSEWDGPMTYHRESSFPRVQ
jgi:hypothetical protein